MEKLIDAEGRVNPFKSALLEILKSASGPCSEYEIIQQLRQQFSADESLQNQTTLGLFQIHFLVMNGLYQLQVELMEDGLYLTISPLEIFITRLVDAEGKALGDVSDARLQQYYLDWQNLEHTDQADVEDLLRSFWQRYTINSHLLDSGRLQAACSLLGVDAEDDWGDIRAKFRRLAAEHHPDRGGDAALFIELREAYEILRCRKAYTS